MASGTGKETVDFTEMRDHEALKALLPHLGERTLTTELAIQAINDDENWMPAAIDPSSGMVHFVNLLGFHLGDEPFISRIEEMISHKVKIDCFSTSIAVLSEIEPDYR